MLGIIIASIFKQAVIEVLKTLKVESFLRKYGVPEAKEGFSWTNILAELVHWFIIIIFLIPTADVWGLPQIVTVLNTFLFYLPNVFVAAIIGVVGFVFARLAHDIVLASAQGVSPETAKAIASVIRWAVIVFVLLAVLNQLGVGIGDSLEISVSGNKATLIPQKQIALNALQEIQSVFASSGIKESEMQKLVDESRDN